MALDRSYSRGLGQVAGSVVLVSLAQISLRYGMLQVPGEPGLASYLSILELDQWPVVVSAIGVGMLAYALSMLCWIAALTHLPLSLAYPLLSSSYLLVYGAASLLPGFAESVSAVRVAGIALVMIGVGVVAWPTAYRA